MCFSVDEATRLAVPSLYDRLAPAYDALRGLWVKLVGGPAERALVDDLAAALEPGMRILDAGCATGAIARKALALEPTARLTLLDASERMLAKAEDVPGERVAGDVQRLPFADGTFDLVVSAWAVETVDDPLRAVSEYVRAIAPHGHVLYTFCSLPDGSISRAGTVLLRAAVSRGSAGDFLAPERTPWHDCGRSHRRRFQGGLTTQVSLRKCCTVGDGIVPPAAAALNRPQGAGV
jgi:ubiquinone/menaquinone biosynthesis C-methylase UbiE